MNCSHVKRAIDLASMNKEALPVEARHHIETCETCRKTLDASLFLDEGLRGLELEDAPQGMEARIAARIAKIAADKQRTKKKPPPRGHPYAMARGYFRHFWFPHLCAYRYRGRRDAKRINRAG